MATSLLSPNAKQQFLDNAGNPAAGYKLFTYAANTTTPQATYTNRAGTVANANPIVLDARGEATVYLTPGIVYDYVLKTAADVTVWTREDVSADAGDAAAVFFDDTLAPAYLKTVSDIINGSTVDLTRFIPPAQHAAIRARTTTYDAGADINTALASGARGLLVPSGMFLSGSLLTLPDASIAIYGEGIGISSIRFTGPGGGLSGTLSDITRQVSINDLSLQTSVASGGTALNLGWPTTASWTKATFTSRNLEICPTTNASNYWTRGIVLNNAWNAVIDSPKIRGMDNTLTMTDAIALLSRSNDVVIRNPHVFFADVGVSLGDLTEGTTIADPRIVYANYGLNAVSTTADAPFFTFYGGHVAAFIAGVNASKRSQSHVYDNTFYKRGESTSAFVGAQFQLSDDVSVHNNLTVVLAGATGTAAGTVIVSGARAKVNHNTTNGCNTCVEFQSGASDYTAVGNRRVGGSTTLVASGSGSNRLADNLPADTNGFQTFAANATTPDVSNAATGNFATANSAPTTITNFLNGYTGQEIRVLANDANTTIQHNASINLQGGVNATLGAAAIITLRKMDIWREVGRRTA